MSSQHEPVSRHALMQVAQKAFIVNDPGWVLMVRYGAEGNHEWDLPGGRLEHGETGLDAALVREVREETGLVTVPGRTLSAYLADHSATGDTALFLIREATVSGGVLTTLGQVPEDHIVDLRWYPLPWLANIALNPSVAMQLLVRAWEMVDNQRDVEGPTLVTNSRSRCRYCRKTIVWNAERGDWVHNATGLAGCHGGITEVATPAARAVHPRY